MLFIVNRKSCKFQLYSLNTVSTSRQEIWILFLTSIPKSGILDIVGDGDTVTRKKPNITNQTIEDTYYYLCCLHELGIDPFARELYLTGEPELSETLEEPGVEHAMVSRFIKNLRKLELDSSDPILIHMKTCGGFVEEGFAVYDAIRFCPCHVTILSYTHARSMSSIILQAADHRVLMPNSLFMIHWGTAVLQGEHSQVLSWAEFIRKMEVRFIGVYLDRMAASAGFKGQKREFIETLLRDKMGRKGDVILTPSEAIAWNLADEVFDGDWEGLAAV